MDSFQIYFIHLVTLVLSMFENSHQNYGLGKKQPIFYNENFE